MAEVFISYSSGDRSFAQLLAGVLQDNGLSVWFDQGLGGDTPYHEQISEHLDQATVVIACWSARSMGSRWVYSEADAADKQGKLINLRLDATIPPRPFDRLNAHDLSGWIGDKADRRLQGLLEDLLRVRLRSDGGEPDSRPLPADTPATRAWLHIHNSLNRVDYEKFLARHPDAPQRRLAEQHISDLDAFENIPENDPEALHDFLISGPFESLGELAKAQLNDLSMAGERLAEAELQAREVPIIRGWMRLYWFTVPLGLGALLLSITSMLDVMMMAQANPESFNPWTISIGFLGTFAVILGSAFAPALIARSRVRRETFDLYFQGAFRGWR